VLGFFLFLTSVTSYPPSSKQIFINMCNDFIDIKDNPWLVLAWATGIAIVIAAAGWALFAIIQAIGIAIGTAGALINEGIKLTSGMAWWAGLGLTLAGLSTTVVVVIKVFQKAEANPYAWAAPILAIVSGFVIDMCKELYDTDSSTMRMVYGGCATGMFLIGSFLWNQKKVGWHLFAARLVASLFFLLPPFMIYLQHIKNTRSSFLEGYKDIPVTTALSIGIFLLFVVVLAYIAWAFDARRQRHHGY
jgi:hypothetical protein